MKRLLVAFMLLCPGPALAVDLKIESVRHDSTGYSRIVRVVFSVVNTTAKHVDTVYVDCSVMAANGTVLAVRPAAITNIAPGQKASDQLTFREPSATSATCRISLLVD